MIVCKPNTLETLEKEMTGSNRGGNFLKIKHIINRLNRTIDFYWRCLYAKSRVFNRCVIFSAGITEDD